MSTNAFKADSQWANRSMTRLAFLVSLCLLTACEQGGFEGAIDNVPYFCDTTGGSSDSFQIGCVNCEIDEPDGAADYDVKSFATIRVLTSTGVEGNAALTSFAGFLDPWPAGNNVGVFVTPPENTNGILAALSLRVTTYAGVLQPQQQETAEIDLGTGEGDLIRKDLPATTGPDFPRSFYYFTTRLPFDQFEVSVTALGLHDGGATETKIYGLCSNGGVN